MSRLRPAPLLAAAACLLGVPSGPAPAATRIASINRGTNIALTLSPDEHTLVLSLLGGLWRLPANGGAATQLTPTGQGADNPRFAPNGREVVYQRDRSGQSDLWLLDLKTGAQRRLTATPYDEREPDFTPDGRSIVFASNKSGRYQLWQLALQNGSVRRLTADAGDDFDPAVSSRGDIAYVRRDGLQWSLRVRTAAGEERQLYAHGADALSAPSWRPGGRVLIFDQRNGHDSSRLELLVMSTRPIVKRMTEQEDVFAKRVAWVSPAYFLYAADGRIWRRALGAHERSPIPFFAGVAIDPLRPPAVTTDLGGAGPYPAARIGSWAAAPDGKRYAFTALGDLWLRDGNKTRRLTNDDYVERDPAFFPDGRRIVFASDRGGHMNLWSVDSATGAARALTRTRGKAFAPAVDGTGRRIAYLVTDGFGPWAKSSLQLLRLGAGDQTRLIVAGLIDAGRPRWTQLAGHPCLAVDARTAPAGPRRWRLFDLHGKSVAAEPGSWTPPPTAGALPPALRRIALKWAPPKAHDDYIVQAGRLFDGVHAHYLRNMDLEVRGRRIVAVGPRGTLPAAGKVIDARGATIIPGLIDVRARQSSLAGRRLGQAWLAYGVTTVREVTRNVPAAVEQGEAWASGRRLGPRLVVTPAEPAQGRDRTPGPRDARSPVIVSQPGELVDVLGSQAPLDAEAVDTPEPALPDAPAALGAAAVGLRWSALGRSYGDDRQMLLASGAIVTSSLGAAAGPSPALVPASDSVAGAVLRRLFSAGELQRWRGIDSGAAPRMLPLQRFLVRFVQEGGHIAIGSDAPAVPYGFGMLHEMQLLAQAGLPTDQVLRLATAEGAIALGLGQQLGTLEPGKLADFVVLNGDPLADIGAIQQVSAVVKGGVWMRRRQLVGGAEPNGP